MEYRIRSSLQLKLECHPAAGGHQRSRLFFCFSCEWYIDLWTLKSQIKYTQRQKSSSVKQVHQQQAIVPEFMSSLGATFKVVAKGGYLELGLMLSDCIQGAVYDKRAVKDTGGGRDSALLRSRGVTKGQNGGRLVLSPLLELG